MLLPLLVFLPRFQVQGGTAVRATLVFVGIVLVPIALLIWRSFASGRWRTVDASDKEDRPALYNTSILVLLSAAAYFHFVERSPALVRGFIVAASMLLVAAALNRLLKISLHVAFARFCGVLLFRVRLGYGLPVLLLVPLLIWSRLVLSRHVWPETIGGAVLGLFGAAAPSPVMPTLEREQQTN